MGALTHSMPCVRYTVERYAGTIREEVERDGAHTALYRT